MMLRDTTYDFVYCEGVRELIYCIRQINENEYTLIAVTQNQQDVYTLFFRRSEPI